MQRVIIDTLASSSAHGISRAASVRSRQLQVVWLLLFLGFTTLFCKDAITLVNKLLNASIVTVSQVNRVPFQFPDLYACPRQAISGSIPYALSDKVVAAANAELGMLELFYKDLRLQSDGTKYSSLETKSRVILNSLSAELLKLLVLSRNQSIVLKGETLEDNKEPIILSEMKVLCFKISIKNMGTSGLPPELIKLDTLELKLFTDPYNSHINYTAGRSIQAIVDPLDSNKTAPVSHWDLMKGIRDPVTDSGFVLLLVPRGSYPSVLIEPSITLAPGQSYDISLSMEQVTYSDELHGKNCTTNEPGLQFVDLLNGGMLDYNYSYAGCLFSRLSRQKYMDSGGFVWPNYQIPWDLRNSMRWETLPDISQEFVRSPMNFIGDPKDLPNCKQPCERFRYKASFSATKWPTFSRNYSDFFTNISAAEQPALKQLAKIAERLDSGDHSSHLEATFRSLVADSMLRVRITAENPMSTRLVIAESYSITSFLADVGGILGLYIGCSLLTVCELIELIYHLVACVFATTRGTPKRKECDETGDEEMKERDEDEFVKTVKDAVKMRNSL